MKTYRKEKNILEWAFGICKGMSELGKLACLVYVC